ncbi:MAG: methylated-DNA--[protein]-cysteine S-methyltransferase [Inquilinus sp.]|nr:methylated-DNA--[protein]-cysteine S-methyltransferase [Inquilinus sp.]
MSIALTDDPIAETGHAAQAENPRVATAIRYLVEHYAEQPPLETVAAVAGLHPHHFQRVFKRWAGISPKRFAQHLTVEHAKELLGENESVLGAALDVGLSGPGRLHDLFVACEAATPGDYKARGRDLEIRYGRHDTPFGPVVIGLTQRGICWLGFAEGDPAAAVAEDWPAARLVPDAAATGMVAARLFGIDPAADPGLPLLLHGTNFQIKVWQALLSIAPGQVASYEDVARSIGRPTAVRAVARAVAGNPIAFLIPCHRVIRKTGALHNYRWGADRKRALLAWEAGRREAASA